MAKGEWPTLTDYGDALQCPQRSLYNFEELREAEVERNHLRRPKGRSGNFAIVYKLTGANGPTAAKFFKNPDSDRERRYKAVSEYLKRVTTGYTVGFDYHEQGVYVNSGYYPVLLMEWVEGLPLGNWFHDKAAANNANALRAIADEWVKLVETLRKSKIAHGDLQHGNVLVVKGELKLVDYDGMYVPDLNDSEQLERGVDAYQHPERANQRLNPNLDLFSAWIILISCRAVAADPGIYARYKTRPPDTEPHENLLFVKEDIHSPPDMPGHAKKAEIWRDLKKSSDPQVRDWAAMIWESIEQPFERVPAFEMKPADPLAPIMTAIAAEDWDAVVQLSPGVTLPPKVKEKVDFAQKLVDWRNGLADAFAKNDLRAIRDAYKPDLDKWKACGSLVQQAKAALKRVALLEGVHAAAKAITDGRAYVKKWDAAAAELASVAEAKRYRDLAEQWRARIELAEAFLAQVKKSGGDERSLAAAWRKVEKRPPFHPDIAAAHEARGRLALQRIELLERLEAIPDEKVEQNDRQLVDGWNEGLLGSCREAAAVRHRTELARERLAVVQKLRSCIAAADKGGDEAAVVAAGKNLAYPDNVLEARVAEAEERLLLADGIRKAFKTNSDRAIKEAWEAARTALPARGIPGAERYQLAVLRCELLDQLAEIDSNAALDQQDESWQSIWNEELLRECLDAKPSRPRFELALKRLKAWGDLQAALDAGDPMVVRARAAAPGLANYPPFQDKEPLIRELIRRADDVDRILNKLKPAAGGILINEADMQVLRTAPELFGAEARRQIEAYIEQRLRTSLRLLPIDTGFELGGGGSYVTLRWTWPDFTLISCCYVALDESQPRAPGQQPLVCFPDAHRRAGGGMRCLTDNGRYATIWPVVNLGWKKVVGQPLFIGPIWGSNSNGSMHGSY